MPQHSLWNPEPFLAEFIEELQSGFASFSSYVADKDTALPMKEAYTFQNRCRYCVFAVFAQ